MYSLHAVGVGILQVCQGVKFERSNGLDTYWDIGLDPLVLVKAVFSVSGIRRLVHWIVVCVHAWVRACVRMCMQARGELFRAYYTIYTYRIVGCCFRFNDCPCTILRKT